MDNSLPVKIRFYQTSDTEEIMQLFYDTVHHINIRDYHKKQVDAWAPVKMDIDLWRIKLSSKLTYLAKKDDLIVGFGQLENNGHIDCFYCHKDFQRQGIGRKILEQIESKARSLGLKKLFTEASITAKPFFESQGFLIIQKQEVECRGEKVINFLMERIIC